MNRLTDPSASTGDHSAADQQPPTAVSAAEQQLPILDRSRSHLRLPVAMVTEAMRIAHLQSMPESSTSGSTSRSVRALEEAGIMTAGLLDPVAYELLNVVNRASLLVAVDLRYGDDSSVPTIWATPRRAVLSGSIDPGVAEFRSVPVNQLPQLLAELIVLQSPDFVAEGPLSVGSETLGRAAESDDRQSAVAVLAEGGLHTDEASLILDLQRPDVRRWKITSTWSTDDGQETSELQGVDAGPSGQWLIGYTGGANGDDGGSGQVTYNPQGHGQVMSAFRSVLPRNWTGTPLNRPDPVAD
jgi:hypothetical protein